MFFILGHHQANWQAAPPEIIYLGDDGDDAAKAVSAFEAKNPHAGISKLGIAAAQVIKHYSEPEPVQEPEPKPATKKKA